MAHHPATIIYNNGWFNKNKIIKNIPEPCCIIVDKPHIFSATLPNIFIHVEPNVIINNEQYLIENYSKYHTIFTYNQNVLNKCSNAKKYIAATSWIDKSIYNNIDITIKKFKISNLAGAKNGAPGHNLRILFHYNQDKLSQYPITFFRSYAQTPHIKDFGNNPFIGIKHDSKVELFLDYQFAIVIENCRQTNGFTEKIIDCLVTKTIPIYWGCDNIGDYFDTTGWIILETETIEELQDKLKALTPDYYDKHKDIIEKNHTIALKYIDFYENLNNAI